MTAFAILITGLYRPLQSRQWVQSDTKPVENSGSAIIFSQTGGINELHVDLVENHLHIRGISCGQSKRARILLRGAGDGDHGRTLGSRSLWAVF